MKFIDYYRRYHWAENGVSYNAFVSRIKSWWKRKDAVSVSWRAIHRKKYEKKREYDPSYFIIDIKYKWEEAIVFAVIYEDMIKELANQYEATDEPQEAHDILEKKKKIEEEYKIFLSAQV